MRPRLVPPAPWVMAQLYEDYITSGRIRVVSFRRYLEEIGYRDPAVDRPGMDDGKRWRHAAGGPELISVPQRAVSGPIRMLVLLVDFPDLPGRTPPEHFEELLFTEGAHPTGSMRDYYREVTLGSVLLTGSVHGWLRLPERSDFYANGESGTGADSYPRNAPAMAEHAVRAAVAHGVPFDAGLDVLGDGVVTALFIVHAGPGAEVLSPHVRGNAIWSHKWRMADPIQVANGLWALTYLTVPEDAKVGVCAHELGHLVFQWEDFYDPNYAEDGKEWDGAGSWDLMAGGSHNEGGVRPAHPAGLHKLQHGWIEVVDVDRSGSYTILPYSPHRGQVLRVYSERYRNGQFLLLENRARVGFDASLPGAGLLVWRVDLSQQMTDPDHPAMLLVQADGRHQLEVVGDWNTGDEGDPFPGSTGRTHLGDSGRLSTAFPGAGASGITLRNIQVAPGTQAVSLDIEIGGAPGPARAPRTWQIEPESKTPDRPDRGDGGGWGSGSSWSKGR